MDWLTEVAKGHVDEAKIEAFIAEVKKVFPEHAIPKEQYNKKVQDLGVAQQELATAKTQMDEVNTKLTQLEASSGDLETMKSSLAAVTKEYGEYKDGETTRTSEIERRLKTDFALERQLRDSKADPTMIDLLVTDFDKESLKLGDDGKLEGFDTQLEAVRGKRPNAFATEKTVDPSGPPPAGDTPETNTLISSFKHGLTKAMR